MRALFACTLLALPTAATAIPPPLTTVPDAAMLEYRMLEVHNRYRAALNLPPLAWDAELAAGARAHAERLGAGTLAHSPESERHGQGENLWRGTAGAYWPESMAEAWAGERSAFRPGTFPDVSTAGDVAAVAHYTQMIWRTTTRIGCAQRRADGNDTLVCRYAPMGNVVGLQVP